MSRSTRKIGILTGGGDCPGLNAVIRAVTKKAILDGKMEVLGFLDGYKGLVGNRKRRLLFEDVSGILTRGGTILGTSKIINPYHYPVKKKAKLMFRDLSQKAIGNCRRLNLDALVCIGGDGTLGIAYKLFQDGLPVVGIPKTIDNDLRGTDLTVGFHSAVATATEGIDILHSTAESHHRVMIIEVMGHHSGWIALYAGLAGGGDIILIPEIHYDIQKVARVLRKRHRYGKRFSIVVIAEGARPIGGRVTIREIVKKSLDPVRLGGVGFVLAESIKQATSLDTRVVVLGHLQRGGPPTPFDRVLATRLGTEAVDLIVHKKFGQMVGLKGDKIVAVPLSKPAQGPRKVPLSSPIIKAARCVNTCFGD